ncbi:hypothetical protein WKH57_15280 [Niallia taxi]|uniref:hypothetical protein n=1 Tax=Niallia taxi TaxID=2499688 RepID=UPI003170C713
MQMSEEQINGYIEVFRNVFNAFNNAIDTFTRILNKVRPIIEAQLKKKKLFYPPVKYKSSKTKMLNQVTLNKPRFSRMILY